MADITLKRKPEFMVKVNRKN